MPTPFTNQATLSYNGLSVLSNIASGELVQVLTAAKNAAQGTYLSNDTVTYTVSLINSGTANLTGLTVTDDLGGYTFGANTVYPLRFRDGSQLYYVNGTLQPAPAVTAGPPLTFTGINIPAGGNAMLVYEADVTNYAPLGATDSITNTATVTGTGISAPITAQESIAAGTEPALEIAKSMSPTSVTENGTLTYTFVISNLGNTAAEAGAGVTVSDTFNPVLNNISVTLNGAPLPAGSYSYNPATGAFSTTAGVITVPAAAYAQDAATGAYTITPGTATLTVSGTV